jgi:hypothetical protein
MGPGPHRASPLERLGIDRYDAARPGPRGFSLDLSPSLAPSKPSAMTAKTSSISIRICSFAVAAFLCLPTTPVAAAGPAKKPEAAAAATPATGGKTVALLRFGGPPPSRGDLRPLVQAKLEENGFSIKSVALDLAGAGTKVKCKGTPDTPECLATIGKWLNSSPKTAADYIVYGTYTAGTPQRGRFVVYDIAKATVVREFTVALAEEDLVGREVLPAALATGLVHHITPPPAVTPEEQKILDTLDEPEKTPEQIAAEQKAVEDAEADAARAAAAAAKGEIDTENIPVDLRADFKDFCREGPRKKRKTRDDPKDLRPKCQRGPVFGYWQPRAWVALGLTIGAGIGTITAYSLALVARGPYKDAVSDLDDYVDGVDGDPTKDPNATENNGVRYDALATEVSQTGSLMRRRAIVGDVLLGTTVLLTGVLAIIIFQDRTDAKNYIKQEKGLRAISKSFRFGPSFSKTGYGGSLGFKF